MARGYGGWRSGPETFPEFSERARAMEKTIRIFENHKDMKAEEYRYWQSRPVHERMQAVTELTVAAYKMKDPDFHVRPIERTLAILDRTQHQPDGYAEPR